MLHADAADLELGAVVPQNDPVVVVGLWADDFAEVEVHHKTLRRQVVRIAPKVISCGQVIPSLQFCCPPLAGDRSRANEWKSTTSSTGVLSFLKKRFRIWSLYLMIVASSFGRK